MKPLSVTLFLVLGLLVAPFVQADDDHERARQLKESGQILPLHKIIEAAQEKQPGRVIEVELKDKGGHYVYEVELLDVNGRVWELLLDAANGTLIKRERED